MWKTGEEVRGMADENKMIGEVTHFYDKISVAVVRLEENLEMGTAVRFMGNTTDFEQVVDDMQFDHKEVEVGKKGQEVGIKVSQKVREGDRAMQVK